MGQVLSATSVYANAYLTKKGRGYLFNQDNSRFVTDSTSGVLIDFLKITHFSMSDPDTNYRLLSGVIFESGDVPDISGKNESCIKGTALNDETNLIAYDPGKIISTNSTDSKFVVEYDTDWEGDILVINANVTEIEPDPLSSYTQRT